MKANQLGFIQKLNKNIRTMKVKARKNSPEIYMALGVVGVVTGVVLACFETTKLDDVRIKRENRLAEMHDRLDIITEDGIEVVNTELQKETTMIYAKSAFDYVKLYAPAFLVTGTSLGLLVASNVILRRRLFNMTAAYAAVSQSFKDYRGRVSDRFGADIEKEIRYNIQPKEIEVIDKDGNITTETIKVSEIPQYSDFARVYDDGNIGWSKDPMTNLQFLKCQEAAANQRLVQQGYLFVNDVYEMLGFPKIPEGQVAGWIYDEKNPIGDNEIDFGIYNATIAKNRDFINGYERSIMLDFNIDGRILEKI